MVYSSEEWGDKNKKMLLNLKIPVKKNLKFENIEKLNIFTKKQWL